MEKIIINFDSILTLAMEKGASDVHLKAGIVPIIRKHGQLRPLDKKLPALNATNLEDMARAIMSPKQEEDFEKNKDLDMGYGIAGLGRFRINIFQQRGTLRMVIRNIPHTIPTIEELNLPSALKKIAQIERGLILVTGATGSGKSSTLAAMIDSINRTKNKHILMIEDPIEYLVRDRKSLITQRELGTDTMSYSRSLRAALRQDPDVILIGEMRDKETIEIALLAAETGHLVLSTLHTLDATESINRILAAFEPHQQIQIRLQLASVLKAIISQRLAQTTDKSSFVPAVEILINNTRIREMITDPTKTEKIRSVLAESGQSYGMQTFDQSLMKLIQNKKISYEEALKMSTAPEDFAIKYAGVSTPDHENWSDDNIQQASEWGVLSSVEIENTEERDDAEVKTNASIKLNGELKIKKK